MKKFPWQKIIKELCYITLGLILVPFSLKEIGAIFIERRKTLKALRELANNPNFKMNHFEYEDHAGSPFLYLKMGEINREVMEQFLYYKELPNTDIFKSWLVDIDITEAELKHQLDIFNKHRCFFSAGTFHSNLELNIVFDRAASPSLVVTPGFLTLIKAGMMVPAEIIAFNLNIWKDRWRMYKYKDDIF